MTQIKWKSKKKDTNNWDWRRKMQSDRPTARESISNQTPPPHKSPGGFNDELC